MEKKYCILVQINTYTFTVDSTFGGLTSCQTILQLFFHHVIVIVAKLKLMGSIAPYNASSKSTKSYKGTRRFNPASTITIHISLNLHITTTRHNVWRHQSPLQHIRLHINPLPTWIRHRQIHLSHRKINFPHWRVRTTHRADHCRGGMGRGELITLHFSCYILILHSHGLFVIHYNCRLTE